jgi:thioredoxin 1
MPTEVLAPLHFRTLLTSHTYLIADFYATWCPPCKQIAPIYAQLSAQHNAPGKFAFVKINVDEQRELAGQYGVTAMPTFLVFREGKKVQEVRGADVRGLKMVVEGAAADLKSTKVQVEKESVQRKPAEEKKAAVQTEPVKEKEEGEEKTVSGSYGMSKNSNWKMSLH